MKKTSLIIVGVALIVSGWSFGSSKVAFAASCNLNSFSGPLSVQEGQTISNKMGSACAPNKVGIEWACNYTYSLSNTDVSIDIKSGILFGNATQATSQVTGVTAGSVTVTYTAECSDGNDPDQTASKTVIYTVTPGPQPPTTGISASPNPVTSGNPTTLTLKSSNATACSLSGGQYGGGMSEPGAVNSGGFNLATQNLSADTTYALTCTNANGSSKSQVTVTVKPPVGPPPGAGTIKVTSENSVTKSAQASSWVISGPSGAPCTTACSGVTGNYTGVPAGSGSDQYTLTPTSIPSGYTLDVVCGFLNSNPTSCPNAASSFVLAKDGDTVNFFILLNPEAAISVSPTSLSGSGSFTITNSGTAGSQLNWQAKANDSCAAVGTASGKNLAQGSSAAENVTVTGSCTATITITGTSVASGKSVPSKTVQVSTGGGPGGPGAPTVTLSANPGTVTFYSTSTLTWTVLNATACTASANPPEADWNGSKSSTGGKQDVSPAVIGNDVYTLTCTGPGGQTAQQATVKVNAGAPPQCTISANPTSLVIPQTSTLTYTCTNVPPVDSCTLGGSDGSSYSVTRINNNSVGGTQNVGPKQTTNYTVSCQDPNNAGVSASDTVSVTVTNSTIGECNPETGTNCPPPQ